MPGERLDEADLTAHRSRAYTNTEGVSEETLMAAYAAGDESAFVRLYASLSPRIYGFFARSFAEPTVRDELLQATFLKIHRARAQYQPALPLRPWVLTIAAHVRRDELRRRRRLREDPGEEALAAAEEAGALGRAPDTESGFVSKDVAERLRDAVGALPESQRVVIHLHRYEGMTFAEIAAVLSTSEVAVRGRAFRAYAQLRKTLQDLVDGSEP